ncbi:dermonecrotic toxin domain-containing protein [Pseudomonas sp. NPDC099000]|uniref:dermonecrotic toxin domain-containing protein n=1 Tax=Pseudomonas sp. NPDC099000 TaxID=3364488 RepID=UPI00383A51A0
MTESVEPYFFDEAERTANAGQPGERENALAFTLDDLKWLKHVYLATDAARIAQKEPMHVCQLLLKVTGKTDIPLAGAFAMSRPDDGEVTLYTPWKGLIKFADMADLKNKLKEWLAQATGKCELLRFLSIEQRSALPAATAPDIATKDIEGAVFQDQQLTLDHNQEQNIEAMKAELLKTPTLQSMLDDTLKHALHKAFPTLDQRLTRLKSLVKTISAFDGNEDLHTISSIPLSDALLHFYLTNQWPTGDSRVFANPEHSVSSDADNQTLENAVKEIAQSFTPHLHSLLALFWNTAMSTGLSRLAFFTEGLRDTFHLKLLHQRQNGTLTTQEYLRLMKVSLPPDAHDPLRIEKVRVTAPFRHFVELASTLMIGDTNTLGFLYSPPRGVEATSNLSAVKKIVLEMMKTEGHEDTLLNFMSLEERATFLALEPIKRVIDGKPVVGPVFKHLMADILGKQRDNLSHALSRLRESEGTLDPHALLDSALDVRGLIDDRLLAPDSSGRWSTRVDRRGSAQPATVRAESAKEELSLLNSVEQALDELLGKHPAISTATRSIEDAERVLGSSVASLQSTFTHTLSTALRSELKLRAVSRTLGTTEQAIIKTVLDSPIHLQRAALNGFLPDVFSLELKAGDATAPLKLASCFVLTERGGLDAGHSGKAILWTPALGFESFKALTPLLTELDRRLADANHRSTLLENLGRNERLPGRTYTLAPLQRVYGHFLDYLQKPYVHLDQACLTDALATKLSATPLSSLLNLVSLRKPMTGLDRPIDIARSLTTRQKLPAWLAQASVKELIVHAELLQQYLDNVKDDQDYLSGIRSLQRTAHHELEKQLKADDFNINPDNVQVRINARPTSAARTQTLTDFALTHLKDLDQLHLKLVPLDSTVIPEGMDERYIKDLIRNLKPGEHQQKIVSDALADTPANADRRKRFYTQLPWQLMHYAHTEKLQERLSETGFDLIRQVMDMPDALARAAVDGAHAIIRPLEFLGIKSNGTIKVPGVYLIGSTADRAAPQVLIAPHSPGYGVKEYENEARLLTELKTRGPLLDWLLLHLQPSDRLLLETRMATNSHRVARATSSSTVNRIAETTLGSHPIKGSLFKHLLNDNVALLGRLLGCQSDDQKQGEWAAIKHVLGEDLHEAYTFFMGKLAYPETVWRSYRDIKQSAEDLQTHKWGPAIKAFISGMAELSTLRQSLGDPTLLSSTPATPAPEKTDTQLKWQEIDVTGPERTKLKRHESINVDLGSLKSDATLGLYTHPTTKQHYGPVEGKVFPVIKRGTRWRIGDTSTLGPHLRQNESKQWLIDGRESAPRFSLFRRLETARLVFDGMNVDATGMSDIRRLFPQKARQIDEALDLATTYAWNSYRNLQLLKNSDDTITPVHQLIMDFLGVQQVLPTHVEKVEKIMGDVFTALLEPSLRKPKSSRFAVGRVTEDAQHTFAFIVATDKNRRIHLAERFFDPRFEHYRQHLTDAAFPIHTHARAVTLIHELSHMVCKTEDIFYLDPGRPFTDLIGTATPLATELKRALTDVQKTALSIQTPYTRLFMTQDPDTGVWEDPGSTSNEESNRIKARILELTGAENLSGARETFKKNPLVRLAVQLSNADSVAWLVSHLGRELHVSTP